MLRSLSLIKSALRTPVVFRGKTTRNFHLIPNPPRPVFMNFMANSLHTQSTNKQGRPDLQSIDKSLLRLDTEIRKTGRITRREIEEVLEDIREMKTATTTQSLMILRCCGDLVPEEVPENRTKLVKKIWKTLENLNVAVDISHYNALLRVYLENEYKFDPTEFLQELAKKGIEPNRVTYQRLISRYCQDGNIDGASTILQHMKEKQLPINEHVFNALVLGHAKADDMESAEGMLAVMRQAGLEPNDDTFTTLMSGYAQKGDIANVHRIVKECEAKEMFLIDRDFLTVIYTLAASGHDSLIDEVIPYLKKHSGFNQEATNAIFKLINIGKPEVAYKILHLMPRPVRQDEPVPSGGFFIRQMVISATPSETIVKFCRLMKEDDLNKFALLKACESALSNGVFDKAFDLLEALKESGFPMRQHYFWPFFAGKRSEKQVYDGLKCMISLDVSPNLETLREYVVPALLNASFKKQPFEVTLDRLGVYTGISIGIIAPAALQHLLSIGDVENASKFALRYKVNLSNQYLRRALVDSYLRTRDAKSIARIVGSSGTSDEDAREHAGSVLLEILENSRGQDRIKIIDPLLQQFEENGIGLSNSSAELIQNHLGEHITSEITNRILKLTSGDMVRKVENFGDVRRRETLDSKSVLELEDLHRRNLENNRINNRIQKMLLGHYCREGEVEKAEKIVQELQSQGFVMPLVMQMYLLDMYSDTGNADKAREIYKNVTSTQLDFVMDDVKILRYAHALATAGAYEEMLDLLKNQKRNGDRKAGGFTQNALVWKILNMYADAGDVEKTNEVFNVMLERGLTAITTVIVGRLVRAHLAKDDNEGALAEFERCVNQYKCTPLKGELFVRFIKSEDAERLQKVLDLGTIIHGEVNCLYDLVFAFLECGKVRQAKKILDTPGLRARNEKLESTCQKYLDGDRLNDLENLIEVTKDIFDVDRSNLYFYLLKAHCKANDPDKALSVWTALQEENLQASQEFLTYLANFLRKNDREVPFVLPTTEKSSGTAAANVDSKKELIKQYRLLLRNKNLDQAMTLRERINRAGPGELNLEDESVLIENLIQAERMSEAVRVVEDMSTLGKYPFDRVVRYLFSRLSEAKDVETLRRLQIQMPKAALARSRIHTALSLAMINSGKEKEFLEEVKLRLQDASSQSDTAVESKKFLQDVDVVLVDMLKAKPELTSEVETLSKEYGSEYTGSLHAAIWTQKLLTRQFEEARDILKEKLQNCERLIFTSVMSVMRENKDIELGKELWSQIRDTLLQDPFKGKGLSVLLDILRETGDVESALATLKDALDKNLTINSIPRPSLVSLSSAAEAAGLDFPYIIPERDSSRRRRRGRAAASSSSSSDSD